MIFFDSHAHYNDESFDKDRKEIINTIYSQGIKNIINVGYNISSSQKSIKISEEYDFIYSTCGISPNDLDNYKEEDLFEIENLAKNKKVVAIGEIGLDYYWNKTNKDLQNKVFIDQIKIANKLKLPIVIHTREAIYDTLDILKNKVKCNQKGIFHCCPFNIDLIKEALKLDFYISIAGVVTYKNTKNAEEVINSIPIDKLLIETDSPYLSPEPLRGQRNNSQNLKYIAEKIAQIKKIPIEKIAQITYENTKKAFNLI